MGEPRRLSDWQSFQAASWSLRKELELSMKELRLNDCGANVESIKELTEFMKSNCVVVEDGNFVRVYFGDPDGRIMMASTSKDVIPGELQALTNVYDTTDCEMGTGFLLTGEHRPEVLGTFMELMAKEEEGKVLRFLFKEVPSEMLTDHLKLVRIMDVMIRKQLTLSSFGMASAIRDVEGIQKVKRLP